MINRFWKEKIRFNIQKDHKNKISKNITPITRYLLLKTDPVYRETIQPNLLIP